jgi:hypothetical protein
MIEKLSNNQSRGGSRPGAGRKKGLPNRKTAEAQAQAEEGGVTPLEFLLNTMRDDGLERRERLAAAVAAAPYVHAKLSAVALTGDINVAHRGFIELPPKRER